MSYENIRVYIYPYIIASSNVKNLHNHRTIIINVGTILLTVLHTIFTFQNFFLLIPFFCIRIQSKIPHCIYLLHFHTLQSVTAPQFFLVFHTLTFLVSMGVIL